MHTAEAHVSTDQASRYITQLCRHAGKMGQHPGMGHPSRSHNAEGAPPPVLHADWSNATGTIHFGEGHCILRASDNMLLLRVEAITESALHRLQKGIAHRLETFGHREGLAVRWQPSTFRPTGQPGELHSRIPAPAGKFTAWWRSRLARNLALAAIAAVAVAAHLGPLGAKFAFAMWTKWGAATILALIVLKFIVAVGVHLSGGTAFRRGKALLAKHHRHPPH
ncbi:DUF2218 domain-containing protein [Mesorhizobium sp.]|uniref:DUF2218 domain-containing protein n=1 Tax=Mesorhizobium sp. TaxID=1871066 RepID=UPI0025C27F90|nr:DUF2218 domain-containing protein [Mesorhizobium sp.]